MAITWGSEIKDGSNGIRLGYEFSQSPSSVGTGTSSVTVTLKIYFWSRYSVSDSTNSYSITGDFSGSGSADISHGGSGGTTLIRTLTRTVSPSYSGTVRSDFSASITGINAVPGTARTSGAWYTAKRPISIPDDPTGMSVTRVSDSRHNVAWTRTNPTTASKPYQTQELRRWDIASGTYKTIANLSASVTSYVDSSTTENQQYRYSIRAKNTAGSSGWAYTPYISTTPAAPSTLKATKSGGDIRLTWSDAEVRKNIGIEVWLTQNGVDAGSRFVLLGANITSWTHVAPLASSTWSYRVKAKVGATASTETGPDLYSAFSARSNTVQLLTNPAPPSQLSPASNALDGTDDILFKWQHNDVDSTDQTAYELQYRILGASTWTTTGKITSPTSSRLIFANTFINGETIEWQVRTWGEYATNPAYSPWSSTAILTTSARPAATITSPTSTADSSRVNVQWIFFDNEGSAQTAYRVTLEDELGSVIFSRTVNGNALSFEIPVTVADGATYTVTVSVRDGDGVWSYESSQVFAVDYADPPTPIVEVTWDVDLGAVVILIEHPEPAAGEATVDYCQVWRSANAEEWILLADGVPPSTAVTDYIPALDTVNYYRITTVSTLPSSIDSAAIPIITDSEGWLYINGDPLVSGSFSSVLRLRYNPKVEVSTSKARVRQQFAGRTRPVEFSGESETVSINISTDLLDDTSTKEEAEAFARFPAPFCYRDPGGRRLFVSIGDVKISNESVWDSLSMTLEQVDHDE